MSAHTTRARSRARHSPVTILPRAPGASRHTAACRRLLLSLRRALHREGDSLELLIASDAGIRALNRRFRGRDAPTDVLSFPAEGDLEPGRPHLGGIAVSLPRAARQARRARWPLRCEMALLVTHGFLHLLGYDHETDDGAMRRLETRLLRTLAGVALDRRRAPWGEAPARRPRRTRHDRT